MPQKRIFNLSDKEYQFWRPFKCNGKIYRFDHLNARKIIYDRPDNHEVYKYFITFSHHTFTTSFDEEIEHSKIYTQKPTDKRIFCNERYELSLQLPKIIEDLPNQFCYHGYYKRYCVYKLKDKYGDIISYQVVFKVWKEDKKLRLHIESAYPLKQKLSKPKKVSFWIISYNLLNGKKLPIPPNL